MRTNADLMLRTAEHQLSIWGAVIENFYNLVISEIEKKDKIYANNILLGEETKKFELIFIKNYIDGILDFLNERN